MSSNSPPPKKKVRRAAITSSGSSADSKQLTITSMFGIKEAACAKNNDVIAVDDDLPPTSRAAPTSKCRDFSPELFADDPSDDMLLGSESDGGKGGAPCANEEIIKIESSDCSSALGSLPTSPIREKSPSLSTRSSTHSPEPDLPPCDGAPLSEIHFGPSTFPILPPLQSSAAHAVLFRPRLKPGAPPIPFPDKFKDVWDSNHVRMPCSSQSVFPVASPNKEGGKPGNKVLVSRWDIITESLRKPIANSYDLEEAILSYNSRKWCFSGLHSYFSEHCSEEESSSFFGSVLPRVIELALSLPKLVTHALPLLKKQLNYSISLSQQQVACLLANAFLCTFPRRNARGVGSEYASYPSINFNSLFYGSSRNAVSANKLTCLLHYFTRVTKSMPVGVVTFQRQVLATPPQWEKSTSTFTNLHVDSEGTIEDQGHGMLQVDFANSFIGGGVLGEGCVQEEIRFLICPELIVSRLFTEGLDDNECLVMTGAEQFSKYRGYASSFEWADRHDDATTRDRWGRKETQIVAIDALVFRSLISQFRPGTLRRELNKAYCGYMTSDLTTTPSGCNMAVATGNWGCGAFGGNPRLKSLLQLTAASHAQRDVVYFTFGDRALQRDLCTLHQQLVQHMVTVGQVWRVLVQYQSELKSRSTRNHAHLYEYIARTLRLSCDTDTAETVEYSTE